MDVVMATSSGMISCPKCKRELPDGASFCDSCGHQIKVTCPNCGTFVKEDSVFCLKCGKRVRGQTSIEETKPIPESHPTTNEAVKASRVNDRCSACGFYVGNVAKKCPSCGAIFMMFEDNAGSINNPALASKSSSPSVTIGKNYKPLTNEQKKKNNRKAVAIIAVVIVGIIAFGFFGEYVLNPMLSTHGSFTDATELNTSTEKITIGKVSPTTYYDSIVFTVTPPIPPYTKATTFYYVGHNILDWTIINYNGGTGLPYGLQATNLNADGIVASGDYIYIWSTEIGGQITLVPGTWTVVMQDSTTGEIIASTTFNFTN
jgi:hypothetical protein